MKNILKAAGAFACAAAVLCASGCSGDTKWAYKTDQAELKNGKWIYCTFDGFNEAYTKLHEKDENATMENIDWDKEEIDGEPVKDWIYAKAKETGLHYLLMEGLAKDNGITVDEATFNTAKSYYTYFYQNYYSDIFTKLGVSEESYCELCVRPGIISDELFKKMYGTGGVREVPMDEVKTFFTDNYISYYYVSCDLKTTNEDNKSVDIDKELSDKYKENFRKYAAMLNTEGKTTADVDEQYKKDFEVETVPSTLESKHKDDMAEGNLNAAILAAEEGKAITKEIDDKLYLIYRFKITDKVSLIKSSDEETDDSAAEIISKEDILRKMRSDDFDKFIKEERDKLQYDRNDACVHKYDVTRLINIVKENS